MRGNAVDTGFACRSCRDCRDQEAMEGKLHSPPCVLDTGNPCRYDGCVNNIGDARFLPLCKRGITGDLSIVYYATNPPETPPSPLLQRGVQY